MVTTATKAENNASELSLVRGAEVTSEVPGEGKVWRCHEGSKLLTNRAENTLEICLTLSVLKHYRVCPY